MAYQCKVCQKTYTLKPTLNYHIKNKHSNQLNDLFTEDEIQQINIHYASYVETKVKSDEKRRSLNICRICNKSNINKQYLYSHMKIHLNPETMHLFTSEEIGLINKYHTERSMIRSRSYHNNKKVKRTYRRKIPIPKISTDQLQILSTLSNNTPLEEDILDIDDD